MNHDDTDIGFDMDDHLFSAAYAGPPFSFVSACFKAAGPAQGAGQERRLQKGGV